MELAPGQTIGAYRLIRKLGEGTTSCVFEVEHVSIRRRAAMKIAHSDAMLPGISGRLFAEARAVNLINHPNIVAITEIVEPTEQHPAFALVMELLDGRRLADLIAAQGGLAPPRFLPILAQVCDGLAAVHAAGFVHRDLKPENIFIGEGQDGCDLVKLLDFGLVKTLRGDVASPTATCEGTFMGSPAYASPEQAQGEPVDHRTDIYAVGIMVYEVITGRLPFEAEGIAEVLMKQITVPPPRLPAELLATDIGRALDAIVQTCLAKDPAGRTLTAAQLADTFRRLAAGERIAPARIRGARGPAASSRRRRSLSLAVASGAAVAAAALLLGFHGGWGPGPSAPLAVVAIAPAAAVALAAAPAATAAAVGATVADESPKSTRTPEARRSTRPARGNVSRSRTLDPYR